MYSIPETTLSIKFYDYGAPLDTQSTYGTLQTAVQDVMLHIWGDIHKGNTVMKSRPRGYSYGTSKVRLLLIPQSDMTWGMWGETLKELRVFGQVFEFVELRFDIIDGVERMGSGQFWKLQ